MDGYLRHNLSIAKEVIKKDWDMVFLVDGSEGSGKSMLACQCAYFCDKSLALDRIVFTPNEFRKAIIKAKPYRAVVYDEAYTGLSSRATMSLINRTLIKMLAEIRQKNLFVFVVMPTFFDLDKYVALWRSRALLHVYTSKNFQRGFFSFFNSDRKKELYVNGKKYYSYGKPKANFIGRFCNQYVIDETEYRQKKKKALICREQSTEEVELKKKFDDMLFERLVNLKIEIKETDKAAILGLTRQGYWIKKKKYEDEKLISLI